MNKPKSTILFLDDSSEIRGFFKDNILPGLKRKFNVDCVACSSYQEAGDSLSADVTIGVLDYCLGEARTGVDFYKEAREKYTDLPLIVFSSHLDISAKLFKMNEEDINLYVCENKNWNLLEEMLTNILNE